MNVSLCKRPRYFLSVSTRGFALVRMIFMQMAQIMHICYYCCLIAWTFKNQKYQMNGLHLLTSISVNPPVLRVCVVCSASQRKNTLVLHRVILCKRGGRLKRGITSDSHVGRGKSGGAEHSSPSCIFVSNQDSLNCWEWRIYWVFVLSFTKPRTFFTGVLYLNVDVFQLK